MADRGFKIQDLLAAKDVTLNIPNFLKGKSQLEAGQVVRDRRIASLRVHVERVIGLAKTYKMIQNVMKSNDVVIADRVIFVIFSLINFRPGIIPK